MAYAENDGVRIYFEVEGPEGAAVILMHHGFMGDLESWRRRGWVERLGDRFRLILMDSRGHGRSDKPHGLEAYDARTRVFDVVSVLNANDVRQAHYLGYSMGGIIGLSMLIYAPQRLLSLSVGGASPVYDPNRHAGRSPEEFEGYYQAAMERNPALREAFESGRQDVEALRDCRTALAHWGGAEQALRLASVPVLVWCGTADERFSSAERSPSVRPDLRFMALPGMDHGQAGGAVEELLPAVLECIAAAG